MSTLLSRADRSAVGQLRRYGRRYVKPTPCGFAQGLDSWLRRRRLYMMRYRRRRSQKKCRYRRRGGWFTARFATAQNRLITRSLEHD